MIDLPDNYRPATKDDALPMAELVNYAGEGLPVYLWNKAIEPGTTVWDVGQQRARRETGGFSYRNTIVREEDGRVVAALIGYPLPDSPEEIDWSELPAMFVPLQELEDMVPGTWYVNVLASYPEYRGRGFGGELLAIAEGLAAATGRSGMSIIVSDANDGARRLYERNGYREVATRPIVKEQWENRGENWVLLDKPL